MSLYIVTSTQGKNTMDSLASALEGAGVSIIKVYSFGRSFKVEAEESQLSGIEDISYELLNKPCPFKVESVNLDHLKYTVDPTGNTEYDPKYSGENVEIFLVDTGVKQSHVELSEAATTNFYSAFTDNSSEPDFEDTHGHGTAVAGLIVGKNVGAAPQAVLHNVKIFNQSQGEILLSDILDALDAIGSYHFYTGTETPKVVCMPWNIEHNATLNFAVQNLINSGIIAVCAAGNSSAPLSTVSPASTLPALTVGAFNRDFEVSLFNNTPWNSDDTPTAGFVNYGAALDIFALGVDVSVPSISDDTAYISATGTSVAAGIVAGIVAHYIEWYPEKTSLELKEIIIAEGSAWGREYLVFDNNESVDYSAVNKSIASTENVDTPSLTQKPSGRLFNVKIGETAQTSLGIHPQAENVEILDFAPCPPWIDVDVENDLVSVDLSDLDESFPGVGLYMFAIRGDIHDQTYVEEFTIGVYENADTELGQSELLSYYYDSDTGEYDGVVQSYTLGKGVAFQ